MSTRILVVDDEADTRLFLRTLLTGHGHVLIEAASGAEALGVLEQIPMDAILLDVSLPDRDGYDICKAIRQIPHHLQTPLILITAVYMTAHDEVRGLLAGADDYVRKPFANDVLLARLKTLLRARRNEVELQQRNHELLLLNTLALRTSDTLHLPTLLDTALGTLCDLMHARAGRLCAFEGTPEALEVTRGAWPAFPSAKDTVSIPLRAHGPTVGTLFLVGLPPAYDNARSGLLDSIGSQLAVTIDRARLYSEVQRELEIKNVLLREVQHRVRNSLQGIVGLLTMQMAGRRKSPEASEALRNAVQRIKSMASLQKYLTSNLALTISTHSLIQRVTHHTISQVTLDTVGVPFTLCGVDAELSDKQAQTLGMVLHELIHNAIRHGNSWQPQVDITTHVDEDSYSISVYNRGVLPPGFDLKRDANTGLRICQDLVEREFRGYITVQPCTDKDWTVVTISMPRAMLVGIFTSPTYSPRARPIA